VIESMHLGSVNIMQERCVLYAMSLPCAEPQSVGVVFSNNKHRMSSAETMFLFMHAGMPGVMSHVQRHVTVPAHALAGVTSTLDCATPNSVEIRKWTECATTMRGCSTWVQIKISLWTSTHMRASGQPSTSRTPAWIVSVLSSSCVALNVPLMRTIRFAPWPPASCVAQELPNSLSHFHVNECIAHCNETQTKPGHCVDQYCCCVARWNKGQEILCAAHVASACDPN
jgi:hypothetical protein